jgi:phosphohistidine phosphatase
MEPMKTLLIMRHAKSSWANTRLGDHDRPLNDRGRRDAPRMGRLLLDQGLTPELIVTSSAERALSTAEAVALASDYGESIVVTRELYHADPESILEVVGRDGGDAGSVLVVGHNPGMAELVDLLTGVADRFTTANIAHLSIGIDSWADLSLSSAVELHDLWRPKELK